MLVDEDVALKLFNTKKQRIFPISDGEKWFILPFIKNQYGELDRGNRVHASVIRILKENKITSFKSLLRPLKDSTMIIPDESIKPSPLDIIFEYWNRQKIVTHRAFTTQMKGKINAKLKDYTVEEICETIENYSAILRDKKFFFEYKWTLIDFFQRGFDKFFNEETARANYRINKKRGPRSEPVNPSFKKAKVEMKPKE